MPLCRSHFRVLVNGSMEQITGAGLSTLAGIIIPMVKLVHDGPSMSSLAQGVTGAAGLTGIAVGAAVIGKLTDRLGYAAFFRACAVMVIAGSLIPWLWPTTAMLVTGLFVMGLGVGGGYVLDTDYVSELMPARWKYVMLGTAKGMCAFGFIATAALAWWMISRNPQAEAWPRLLAITAALGAVTFVMRIDWPESPVWLMAHNRPADARRALQRIFGVRADEIELPTPPKQQNPSSASWSEMFRGNELKKVIFSGIPWACEGVGVYGVGVFLPIIVIALGIDHGRHTGMAQVIDSVRLTTVINCFILPGFVIGLLVMRRMSHLSMLAGGFWLSAAGMALLLAAYLLHWPVWISVLAFIVFEVALNAGPHLITFIIPAQIYDVDHLGAGSGIAAMLGKAGAILGVFFMPILLHAGGVTLVLIVCIATMAVGALISQVLGPQVLKK